MRGPNKLWKKEHDGAFSRAVREVIKKDMDLKTKALEYYIENDIPLPCSIAEFLFGDYQQFANNLNKKLNKAVNHEA
jgi:hypothetical protein